MRARLTPVTAVSLALLAGLTAVPAGAAEPPLRLGIMDDALFNYQPTYALRAMQRLHPQIVRYDVDWPAVAPTRPRNARNPDDGAYRFWRTDQVVKQATALGIPVMLTIVHTPGWAGGTARHNHVPARIADLEQFAYAVARRYSGRFHPKRARVALPAVTRYEAWNEPNTATHLAPQFVRSGKTWKATAPALYVKLLGAIYTGVHAAAREAKLGVQVAGGATKPIGHTPNGPEPGVAPLPFLTAIAALHARFDAYSHHPYRTSPTGKPSSGGAVGIDNLASLVAELDKRYPGKHYPLWITEYGLQTKPPDRFLGVSPAAQAAGMQALLPLQRRIPQLRIVIWFLIRDEPVRGAFDAGFQTGLAFNNGTVKPAWRTFQDIVWARPGFVLTSPSVRKGTVAAAVTCDGADRSPALAWSGVPAGTRALALVVEDPDAKGGRFVHWTAWGISPTARSLPAGVRAGAKGIRMGRNGFGKLGYGGPCPPAGQRHQYRFRLLALKRKVNVPSGTSATNFDNAVVPEVLGQALLVGRYERGQE